MVKVHIYLLLYTFPAKQQSMLMMCSHPPAERKYRIYGKFSAVSTDENQHFINFDYKIDFIDWPTRSADLTLLDHSSRRFEIKFKQD